MRKKIALVACLVLGPLCILAGIAGIFRDQAFASESIVVEATIVDSEVVPARKGPDQVKFRVRLMLPDRQEAQESFLTVYEKDAMKVLTSSPLEVAYLDREPQRVRLPGAKQEGWIPVVIGIVLTGVGVLQMKSGKGVNAWKSGKGVNA